MFYKMYYKAKVFFTKNKMKLVDDINYDIIYMLIRNNVKQLINVKPKDLIIQKYWYSKFIVCNTLLNKVINLRSNLEVVTDLEYIAFTEKYTCRMDGIISRRSPELLICYDKYFYTSQNDIIIHINNERIFTSAEEVYFIEMFKRIINLKSSEEKVQKQIQTKQKVYDIRNSL